LPGVLLFFDIFSGVSSKVSQVLHIGTGAVAEEFANNGIAFGNHPVPPAFRQVMSAGVFFATGIEGVDGFREGFGIIFLSDDLADVLQV
ncbi:hypothetical protein R0K18_29400, partial [Pantoea sp. SIMBA_133]